MRLLARTMTLTPPVTDRDHVRGGDGAAVTLVEYGDFDCPYCVEAYPILRTISARFAARLRFVFRHDPRTDLHPHALIAARAAEAAALQGAFWPMHDRLFEIRGTLDELALIAHARALRLDEARFTADLHGTHVLERVRADQFGALRSGVVGTPTYFLDGHHFWGAPDVETLSTVIERKLSARPVPTQKSFRRVDGAGHFDAQYRARLLAESGHTDGGGDAMAFVSRSPSSDSFAEVLGEEFVEIATSGEDLVEDVFNQDVPEDAGGPFVETSGRTEFAHGTDESNIWGATREPFPKT